MYIFLYNSLSENRGAAYIYHIPLFPETIFQAGSRVRNYEFLSNLPAHDVFQLSNLLMNSAFRCVITLPFDTSISLKAKPSQCFRFPAYMKHTVLKPRLIPQYLCILKSLEIYYILLYVTSLLIKRLNRGGRKVVLSETL